MVKRSQIEDGLLKDWKIAQPRVGGRNRFVGKSNSAHINIETRIRKANGPINACERHRLCTFEIFGDARTYGRDEVTDPHAIKLGGNSTGGLDSRSGTHTPAKSLPERRSWGLQRERCGFEVLRRQEDLSSRSPH